MSRDGNAAAAAGKGSDGVVAAAGAGCAAGGGGDFVGFSEDEHPARAIKRRISEEQNAVRTIRDFAPLNSQLAGSITKPSAERARLEPLIG